MTSNDNSDPVNRWATEHYGFQDEPAAQVVATAGSPVPSSGPVRPRAGDAPVPGRRRTTCIAAGVLSLALIAGIGGVATASVADDGGRGGRQSTGRDGAAVRFDDGGGRTGDPGGGRR
jgi:hypothetical protein